MLAFAPDVLCLQEVDAAAFDSHWQPQLAASGFDGGEHCAHRRRAPQPTAVTYVTYVTQRPVTYVTQRPGQTRHALPSVRFAPPRAAFSLKRGASSSEGCALFVRRAKLELVETRTLPLDLSDGHVTSAAAEHGMP